MADEPAAQEPCEHRWERHCVGLGEWGDICQKCGAYRPLAPLALSPPPGAVVRTRRERSPWRLRVVLLAAVLVIAGKAAWVARGPVHGWGIGVAIVVGFVVGWAMRTAWAEAREEE